MVDRSERTLCGSGAARESASRA